MLVNKTILVLAMLVASTVNADFTYFNWSLSGATTGTGFAHEFSGSYTLAPAVARQQFNAQTDPTFISEYGGGIIPRFKLASDSSLSGTFDFPEPLPPGSIMVLFDIDAGESISFTTNSPISLIETLESRTGENSVPPTWNAVSQTLSSADNTLNLETATILDISGVTQITFNYTTPFTTEASIAFAVKSVPDPITGDFDVDGDVDGDDVDFYIGNLFQPATGVLAQLDLDGGGEVTIADHNLHVTTLVVTSNGVTGASLGDVNLDGVVDVLSDAFILVSNLGQSVTSRSQGDLNADGVVNVLGDGFILIGQLGQSNDP